jgi:predicted secreted protein
MARYTTSYGGGLQDVWFVKTDSFGDLQLNKTFGGPNNDVANDVVQTTDGGYALVGTTFSFGAGGSNIWLIKLDSNGNMQWNSTLGGVNNESGWGITQTSDGGYALTGFTNSYGAGGDDLWLVKTDASGNSQWNLTFGGLVEDRGYAVIQSLDGGYVVSGASSSFGAGIQDGLMIKTDATGNLLWNKTYGGTNFEVLRSVIQTSDKGYAMGGTTNSIGAGSYDVWLIKTDTSGSALWNKTYGGLNDDETPSGSVIQTQDDGYAIAGYTNTYGAGGYDFWLIKTDSYGNMQWNKTLGGPLNETGLPSVVLANDGTYVVAGNRVYNSTDTDFVLYKISGEGESGLAWRDSTVNSLTLYRGANDIYWNYVRVQIWKTK